MRQVHLRTLLIGVAVCALLSALIAPFVRAPTSYRVILWLHPAGPPDAVAARLTSDAFLRDALDPAAQSRASGERPAPIAHVRSRLATRIFSDGRMMEVSLDGRDRREALATLDAIGSAATRQGLAVVVSQSVTLPPRGFDMGGPLAVFVALDAFLFLVLLGARWSLRRFVNPPA
jgi:hypothetical protein